MIPRNSPRIKQAHKNNYVFHNSQSEQTALGYIEVDSKKYSADWKNPSTVLKFNSLRPNSKEFVKHPTQKPVALCEYLIKTYTNEGETVLDNCAGSFTTAVACDNTNRNWICIEKEEEYCNIGLTRINDNRERLSLPLLNSINSTIRKI
jgi:site-specific DNA-methyltransferase (adenine-specific)